MAAMNETLPRPAPRLLAFRAALGLAQGIALHNVLPNLGQTDHGYLFVVSGLGLCLALVPPALMLALPVLTARRASVWAVALCTILGGLAAYHAWLDALRPATNALLVVLDLLPICFACLFIAQALVLAAARDGRIVASYPTYFDVAWDQAVQILLGFAFTLLLWAVLRLGAGLFAILGLHGLEHVVTHRWFLLPLCTTGFAVSVNLTELRVQLLRSSRMLFLTLAAWVLPVMSGLTLAFLIALPFTGLHLLWETQRAGAMLAGAGFMLVLLINAAYGDGTPATAAIPLLRWSAVVGGFLLLPLVAIAAYGDAARIAQHGLTPARIFLAADILIVTIYAAGYPLAFIRGGISMRGLQPTNVAAAVAVVALILALWSPIADPVRISVADQVARLRRGEVSADRFDFRFLRRASRYGEAALRSMQSDWSGPDAARVRKYAAEALAAGTVGVKRLDTHPRPVLGEERSRQITVFPAGAALPSSLLAQPSFGDHPVLLPGCLVTPGEKCEAVLADVLGQGGPQVLFVTGGPPVLLEQKAADGPWEIGAQLAGRLFCPKVLRALETGQFTMAQPTPTISAAGVLIVVEPLDGAQACR